MPREKISLQTRAAFYKKDGFYVSDSTIMMCGICNVRLDAVKKDTLDKHVVSASHLKAKEKQQAQPSTSKRQSTIQQSLDKGKKAKVEKIEFIEDTVKWCLQANIPLYKLDHTATQEYLQKYVRGSGDLPCSDTLRRKYVSQCGETTREEIRDALKDKQIVVVADETSDIKGRCVFAILFRTVTATATQEVYLVSCSFLDKADGKNCSRAIIEALTDYNIEYKNVCGLVSDSARYMSTCFTGLAVFMDDNFLHYQCWAHKVNLIGDIFIKELSELNALVVKIKMSFLHGRKIKSAYITFLRENYPNLTPKLFPNPVITRWNSWFKSVLYLDQYMEPLVEFLQKWEGKNASAELVCDMFNDNQNAAMLKINCKFVAEVCVKMINLLNTLEGSTYPFAHLLWEELTQLIDDLKRYSDGAFGANTIDLLNQVNNATAKASLRSGLKECAQKGYMKLSRHMLPCPTNEAFKAIGSLFNPTVAGQRLHTDDAFVLSQKEKVPDMRDMENELFLDGYRYFHRQLTTQVKDGVKVDLIQLLMAIRLTKEEFADKALRTIWAPVNSVDAERFFSKYNCVLTDRRTSLKEDNLETCSMLSFNCNR